MCAVAECDRPVKARGWCARHYQQWSRRPGSVKRRTLHGPTPARFWHKVDKDGPVPDYRPELGPCWIWTGGLTSIDEYGTFAVDTTAHRSVLAHRYSYELNVGPIPDGLQIDHLCRVHPCVNPTHLEPVTQRENVRRGFAARALIEGK